MHGDNTMTYSSKFIVKPTKQLRTLGQVNHEEYRSAICSENHLSL